MGSYSLEEKLSWPSPSVPLTQSPTTPVSLSLKRSPINKKETITKREKVYHKVHFPVDQSWCCSNTSQARALLRAGHWWHMLVILALEKLRGKDPESQASLGCILSSNTDLRKTLKQTNNKHMKYFSGGKVQRALSTWSNLSRKGT